MTKVLVVEDEPDIREIVGKVLEEAGYDVFLACNGAQALERMRAAPSDCILLDVDMPVMDGRAFLAAWRADCGYTRVPVALFTSAGDGVKIAAAMQVQGYVSKPFDLDALTDTVARLIERAGDRRDAIQPTRVAAYRPCGVAVTRAHLDFLRQRAAWTREVIARSGRTIHSAHHCLDQAGWGAWPSGRVQGAG